jgi:hypothetical protein
MRRLIPIVLAAASIVLFTAGPASAASTTATPISVTTAASDGWVPAPSAPYDQPAGARCDFPIHVQPITDQVQMKVLATYPDGSSKSEIYTGALILRVTNTNTGAYFDADASGTAVINYGTDGSMTWYVIGPVLIGFRADSGTLPRGLWVINGLFQLTFSPSGIKTLTMVAGTTDNVCNHIG